MNQQPATVLVAEDDTEIRTALERILRYEGYQPITVNDVPRRSRPSPNKNPT